MKRTTRHELDSALSILARLSIVEEISVPQAARLLKKTSRWVHENFPVIIHSPKSHHVRLRDIEDYQRKRTLFPPKPKTQIGNLKCEEVAA